MKLNPLKKERATDQVERKLIKCIVEGEYEAGTTLPSERELANLFGVGRPTVREVLQRLGHSGWITSRVGMPATVNDYWAHGNLTTLVSIIQNEDFVTDQIVQYLLEIRISLTPAYIRDAVNTHQAKVVALLANLEELNDNATDYAAFDWKLQKELARLSPNPIYRLILNSLDSVYLKMAECYFTEDTYREISREYYMKLLNLALRGKGTEVAELAKTTMEQSLLLWKKRVE